MACFLVPMAEAIVTTIASKTLKSHELKTNKSTKIPQKLNRLSGFLWGGSALLAFEHIWHGEVTPWFPFLTAASNPADAAEMLGEMSTAGVAMALLVTAVWAAVEIVMSQIEKRKTMPENAEEEMV
ncbi:MAG: hypothetical protein ACI4XP_09655 [Acutalibacteraceae bacterium]